MTLGEKITALRSQHKMSQGDLAEKLNVSRQSVSKWETNASIPELDKLLLLSELFGITLDALVKGDAVPEPESIPAPEAAEQPQRTAAQSTAGTRKVIGTILICFGALILLLISVLGNWLTGLLFASPFFLCGAVCLIVRKNTGLWCAWAVFFAVNLYLRIATGITWRLTLFTLRYEPSMNYARLAFAWLEVICFVGMMAATILRFRKKPLTLTGPGKCLYIVGWILFALTFIPMQFAPLSGFSYVFYLFWDWIKVSLFTALLTATLRLLRTHRRSRQ